MAHVDDRLEVQIYGGQLAPDPQKTGDVICYIVPTGEVQSCYSYLNRKGRPWPRYCKASMGGRSMPRSSWYTERNPGPGKSVRLRETAYSVKTRLPYGDECLREEREQRGDFAEATEVNDRGCLDGVLWV